jgi:ABC-type microcin C transport system duplicated ATPase subunit YejF
VLQNGTVMQQGRTETVYKNPKGTYMKLLFDSIR